MSFAENQTQTLQEAQGEGNSPPLVKWKKNDAVADRFVIELCKNEKEKKQQYIQTKKNHTFFLGNDLL